MKKRFIIASALAALVSISLCGCTEREPAALFNPAEPTSSVTFSDDKSAPESLPESSPESTIESTSENASESTPQSSPEYPVQNAASYTVTVTKYENGKRSYTTVETYDDHGNVIKELGKNIDLFYAYEYNDDGTVRVWHFGDDRRVEYEYENGLEIKCTEYHDGGVYSVTTHTYDEHGDEVAMTLNTLGFVYNYAYEFTSYDENGNWIKQNIYGADGEQTGTYTRVLDENGKDISGTLEKENSLFTYEYKYDEDGREVELHTTYTLDGTAAQESRVITEYDERGRISRITEYDLNDGEQIASTKEYKYTA